MTDRQKSAVEKIRQGLLDLRETSKQIQQPSVELSIRSRIIILLQQITVLVED